MERFASVLVLLGAALSLGTFGNARALSSAPHNSGPMTTENGWPESVKDVLAQTKNAMGGAAWGNLRSLRTEGTIEIGGLSGTITILRDLQAGRWAANVHLGALRQAGGFDGNASWRTSGNGELTVHDRPSQSDVTETYQKAYGWWYPRRWPADIDLIGTRQFDGKTFHVLRVTPRGGNSFQMWIDARTHFIARFIGKTDGEAEVQSFGDYRPIQGVEVPAQEQIVDASAGGAELIRFTTIAVNTHVQPSDFAAPRHHSDNISIASGAAMVTIPFAMVNSHIAVPVTINGHTFSLALDSGGINTLSSTAAKAIGIEGKGEFALDAEGTGTSRGSLANVKTLSLNGAVKLRNQTFMIVPISFMDGALGPAIFYKFVVRIDYSNHKLTLIQPSDFDAADAGVPLAIQLTNRHPEVQGTVAGVTGWFTIDTGDFGLLTLNAPFSTQHHLYMQLDAAPAMAVGRGYNGPIMCRVARKVRLTLGPFDTTLDRVCLATAAKGIYANTEEAGNIGSAFLRHFVVTFDYENRKIYLKPIQH